MRRSRGWKLSLAWLCLASMALAGCAVVPQTKYSVEDFAGVWEFVDPQGVTSTMRIETSGLFTVDRAPVEAFRVSDQLAIRDWDGEIDWGRADTSSGVILSVDFDQVRFSTRSPDWGVVGAFQDPLQDSLKFIVGNVNDRQSIDYVRVEDE